MTLLIYGSYGYTGQLILDEALTRGLSPTLAGRNEEKLQRQASEHGLDFIAFPVGDAASSLDGMEVLLNCAGPFIHTYEPLVEACLETGTHYLDITGEPEVFEAIAARDDEAGGRDVMLLPGVGFDVVPSDCLALHLKERVPTASHLALGFDALNQMSRGTALTVVENIDAGGLVRRDGDLERVPTAWRTRRIDFGDGPRTATTIPWGDVSTAYRSTGIPNIEVYTAVSGTELTAMRSSRYLGWLLGSPPIKTLLNSIVQSTVDGPGEEERSGGRSYMWGEVLNGGSAVSRLRLPNSYTLTARTAAETLERVLNGDVKPGYQTPATAYGADFVLDIEGVERWDE